MQKSITEIGEDLITEILIRLPQKSILQCKVLSKYLYSLIESPHLNNCYQRRLAFEEDEQYCVLVCDRLDIHKFFRKKEKEKTVVLPDGICCASFTTLCSSTGICGIFLDPQSGWSHDIVLANPTTREHHLVPPQPLPLDKAPRLAYCGFGFDSNTNDYKVFFIVSYSRPEAFPSRIFILYSTLTREWRTLVGIDPRKLCDAYLNILDYYAAYVNGTCHWVLYTGSRTPPSMLTFDMSREVIGSLLFPSTLGVGVGVVSDRYKWSKPSLTSMNESLALINPQGCDFHVWVMKEYGIVESWTLLCQVSLPLGLGIKNPRFLGIVGDHFYVNEKEEYKGCSDYAEDKQLVSYQLCSGDVERYGIRTREIKRVLPFVPTFTGICTHRTRGSRHKIH